jgi:hypothetical protein
MTSQINPSPTEWRRAAYVEVRCSTCGTYWPEANALETQSGVAILALPDGFDGAGTCPTCRGVERCPMCDPSERWKPSSEFAEVTFPEAGNVRRVCATHAAVAAKEQARLDREAAERRVREAAEHRRLAAEADKAAAAMETARDAIVAQLNTELEAAQRRIDATRALAAQHREEASRDKE